MRYDMARHDTIQYDSIRYDTTQYGTTQHDNNTMIGNKNNVDPILSSGPSHPRVHPLEREKEREAFDTDMQIRQNTIQYMTQHKTISG